jgi:hypothetical protein
MELSGDFNPRCGDEADNPEEILEGIEGEEADTVEA